MQVLRRIAGQSLQPGCRALASALDTAASGTGSATLSYADFWARATAANTWPCSVFMSSVHSSACSQSEPVSQGSGSDSKPPETQQATPATPTPIRDKAGSIVYDSAKDDPFGVQRNWFNALHSQLNVAVKTGMVPDLKGRQKQVFEAVEAEFESLYRKHVAGRGLTGNAHRGLMMACLAVSTHKVLSYELGEEALVREIIRTNLGGLAVAWMSHLHRMRIWILSKLLAEDPHQQALSFLPGIKSDMGELVLSDVVYGPQTAAADTTAKSAAASDLSGTAHSSNNISSSTSGSSSSHEPQLPEHLLPPEERAQRSAIHAKPATSAGAAANANASGTGSSGGSTVGGSNDAVWRVDTCAFHQLLSAEGCPELLSEFCCQYSLQWLRAYEKYGVQVSHEACMAWGDACCKVRIAKGQ